MPGDAHYRNPYTVPGAVDSHGRLRVTAVVEEKPARKDFLQGALVTGLFVGAASGLLSRMRGTPRRGRS